MIATGKFDDAAKLYVDDMRVLFAEVRDALEKGIEYNTRTGREIADAGAATYASARIWIIVALVVTAALCVVAGLTLVATVSKPITRMTEAMQRLAARDLTADIVGVGRGDEIGGMANAVQVFKQAC